MVANARKFNAALARFDVEMRRLSAVLEHIQRVNRGTADLGVTVHSRVLRSEDERRIDAVKFVTGDNYKWHNGVWRSVGEIVRARRFRWPQETENDLLPPRMRNYYIRKKSR